VYPVDIDTIRVHKLYSWKIAPMPEDSMARPLRLVASLILDTALFLTLSLGISSLLVVNFDPAFATTDSAAANPSLVLLNALPAALLAWQLLALTRRGLLSIAASMSLLYALYFANAIKLDLLATPLLPGDLTLLAHLGSGAGLLAHYIARDQMIWLIAGAIALIAACIFDRPWIHLRGAPRLVTLAIAVGLGASMLWNLQPISSVYADNGKEFLAWSPTVTVKKNGVLSTMLKYFWQTSLTSASINHEAADQLLAEHPLPASTPLPPELPDIIVLQSESFFDPARLNRIDTHQMLPALRGLNAGYRHGDLWVPTYGGGTIRTEFEVLTGLAMREFPNVEYPYFSLTDRERMPSLPRTLASRGYQTVAVHPNTRDFWNRATAFQHLGFSEFDAEESFVDTERVGYYHSDAVLVDHILKRLDGATGPLFLFAVSIENHGPYDNFPNADPARIAAQPVPEGIDAAAAARLRGYFFHLENADRALGRLVDALQKRPRRSLLLFYGDHLPGLPHIYSELTFDDGEPPFKQPVPWLLVDTAKAATASAGEATASFYLPALLLDAAGIQDHGYFSLLESLRRADHPGRDWVPESDEGLRAVMHLQQRGELDFRR
jgi:phosphoglycerol transferase MdoB-like AlkP superfamily enzyme